MKNIIITALLLTLGMSAMAQKSISQNIEDKDGKMTIHIESSENGKKEVFDKSYNVVGMSDIEKEKLISRVTDSLWSASGDGERKQFKIKIDRNEDRRINLDDNSDPKFSQNSPLGKSKKKIQIYKDGKRIEKDLDGDGDDDLTIFFKDFGDDMQRKFKDFDHKEMFSAIEPKLKNFNKNFNIDMKDFDFMNESKTVKALKIYPNKPFDNKLNLKFHAPEKGDVNVIVTDINGKEVGSQKFKDFQGDFMGQVDLKKNVKGTVFVTVTQGGDGTAARVVIE